MSQHLPNRHPSCPTILFIGLVFVLAVGSLVGCASGVPTVAVSTSTAAPTATPLPPTRAPTVLPTATEAPAATSSPAPLPTATAGAQALTRITVLHSNDAWGYTLPCG